MNIYWPVYQNLENVLEELTYSIHIDDNQLGVYSSKITDLILRAATEIEALAKELYRANGGAKADAKFDYDCLDHLNKLWILDKKKVILSALNCHQTSRVLLPFVMSEPRTADKKGRKTYPWNNAYQNLKHDRANSLSFGSLGYAFSIMAALFVLNVYYKSDTFKLGKDATGVTFQRGIGSRFFSSELYVIPGYDAESNAFVHSEIEEAIYYLVQTDETRKAWRQFAERIHAEQSRRTIVHAKWIEYVRTHNLADYKGANIAYDALGQDEYISLVKASIAAVGRPPIDGEHEARINKGSPPPLPKK
ncbi:MAG: hypothetical protein JNN24_11485 [Hyphomicrobium zavarzinii]|jgi:hypothetical protein|nr:hypothetical protein [Hyphomicrobium zavarzinii]